MSNLVSKQYIEREYKLAKLDYQLAKNDDERFLALRSLHQLDIIASLAYGFDYSDSLKTI